MRQSRVLQILVEEVGKILPRFSVDEPDDAVRRDGAVRVSRLKPAENREPERVVVDRATERVQNELSLVVHVGRSLFLDIVGSDDRLGVADILLFPVDVGEGLIPAELILHIEGLGVGAEALVDPHVGDVFRGDAVSPPLVRALMHNDEIEPEPHLGRRTPDIAVKETVSVGDRALVFHPIVRGLDQLIAIAVKRVFPEKFLVRSEHQFDLLELGFRRFQMVGKDIIIERQRVFSASVEIRETSELADVDSHVVVVDRVTHEPIVARPPAGKLRYGPETAVRNVHQSGGNRDADQHAVGLIRLMVLVRPPEARPRPLACDHHPRVPRRVLLPGKPAVPGGIFRDLRISRKAEKETFAS